MNGLSVIVCTHNRQDLLALCLKSLCQQDTSTTYEIIVVLNACTDDSELRAHECLKAFEHKKIVREPKIGLSHAKNTGISLCKYDFVAFVDDDAKAKNDFVQQAINTIKDHNFAAFGGFYLPWYTQPKPKWFNNQWASNAYDLEDTSSATDKFFAGGVAVFNKAILVENGGFSPSLGMSGKRVAYGEEVELQVKLKQKGYTLGINPNLIIYHWVAPYKMKWWWQVKSAYALGRDSWSFNKQPKTLVLIVKTTIALPINLAKNVLISLAKLSKSSYYVQNAAIDILQPAAFGLGRLIG